MYAIVNIAGQQYKVEKDQKIFVHRLAYKEGDSVSFDEVLLIDNDSSVMVGKPTIKGAMITGKVISHPKGDKVQVFKKKRRKGYQVRRGHRQYLTEIHIQNIIDTDATKEAKPKAATKADTPSEKKPAAKAAPAKKATPAAKAAPEKKAAPATKAAAPKKEAAKKKTVADAKKTTAKKETSAKKPAAKPAAKKSTGTTGDKTDKE